MFALCCLALPADIFATLESRAAIGTVMWVAIWWVTAPVDYAVTAFLPIVINAFLYVSNIYPCNTSRLRIAARVYVKRRMEADIDCTCAYDCGFDVVDCIGK